MKSKSPYLSASRAETVLKQLLNFNGNQKGIQTRITVPKLSDKNNFRLPLIEYTSLYLRKGKKVLVLILPVSSDI